MSMPFILKYFDSQLRIFNCVDNMVPNLNEPSTPRLCPPPWYLGTGCTVYHVHKNKASILLDEGETCVQRFDMSKWHKSTSSSKDSDMYTISLNCWLMLYSLAIFEAITCARWHMTLLTLVKVSLAVMKVHAATASQCWGCLVPLNGSGACKHLAETPHVCLSTSTCGIGGCNAQCPWYGQDLFLILGCHWPPDLSCTIVGPRLHIPRFIKCYMVSLFEYA
jgi:hypothetical protein